MQMTTVKTQNVQNTLPFYPMLPEALLFGMYPGFAHLSFW